MRYLTFALGKGRLAKTTLEMFEKIGITCEEMKDKDTRKVIFVNEELKLKSRFYYKQDAWQKLPKDMIDAIKYVNANYPKINCEDIIIMGADIGANAGMIGAMSLKKVPNKIVLISPMLKFKGLAMPVGSSKFVDTKIFMALAKTDRILINFGTKTKPIVKYYPIGGPGNHLIRANKDAFEDIFNFIVN